MAPATEFTLFETAIGPCGIAWHDDRIAGAQLPEHDAQTTRARMQRRFPNALERTPPRAIQTAVDRIRALLAGGSDDLAGIALDMTAVAPFERAVYEATRAIRPGSTRTYGEIAAQVGAPGSARAVGQALGKNPYAPIVPCHRVVAADGRMHGFSGGGGVATKLRMLAIEGYRGNEPTLF